jgi:two-component system nitrogen regulation response regulator NtrX
VQETEVGAVLLEGLAGAAATTTGTEETRGTLAARVDAFERKTVLEALERNRWRMTRTAEQLGLERSHLYKKLKALGIERPVEE